MKNTNCTLRKKGKTEFGALQKKERLYATLAVIPALLLFCTFTYWPLLKSMFYSLTDWNGYSTTYNFVGLDNFKAISVDSNMLRTLLNTVYFSLLSTVLGTIIQLIFAVILHKSFKGCNVYRTLYYIPVVVSFMIMSLSWRFILQYDGVINSGNL